MKNQILFNLLLVSILLPTTTFAQSLEASSPDSDHAEKSTPNKDMLEYHCAYGDNESYKCIIDGYNFNIVKPTRWLHQHIFEITTGLGLSTDWVLKPPKPYGLNLTAIYLYPVNEYYLVGGGITMHTTFMIPSIHIENRFRLPITDYIAWFLSVPFQIYIGFDVYFIPGIRTGFEYMITQTENYGLGMVINGGIDILFSREGLYYFFNYDDSTKVPIAPTFTAGFLLTF